MKESEKERSHHVRVGVYKAENSSNECDLQASAAASEAISSNDGKTSTYHGYLGDGVRLHPRPSSDVLAPKDVESREKRAVQTLRWVQKSVRAR